MLSPQPLLGFLDGLTVLCEVAVHEGVLNFGVAAHNGALHLFIGLYDPLRDFFVGCYDF